MTLPKPGNGLVVWYNYLWLREHREGREEGIKDRPCAIILAAFDRNGEGSGRAGHPPTRPTMSPARSCYPTPSSAISALTRDVRGSCLLKATCSTGLAPICAASAIVTIAPSPMVFCRPVCLLNCNAASLRSKLPADQSASRGPSGNRPQIASLWAGSKRAVHTDYRRRFIASYITRVCETPVCGNPLI